MIGVDIFSGAGGMSLGASQAGIDVRLAIEVDPHAAATYSRNHPHTKMLNENIQKFNRIDLRHGRAERILFGGPPCQGFSTSNQKTRSLSNQDNWLFHEFIRIAASWKPEWIVFENVRGMTETEHGVFLSEIITHLERLKYTVVFWILNSADYGIPQKRFRLFIIGSRHGRKPSQPNPTHPNPITVNEAIHDLPDLQNGSNLLVSRYKSRPKSEYAKMMRGNLTKCTNHQITRNAPHIIERYKHIPQGGNWEDIPLELMHNYTDCTRCHTGIYHRLAPDSPSIVIGNYRKNMLIHPTQDRGLSVREAARLQSFPDWYTFEGSIGFQQQQVGNAVPPLLAQKVFEAITHAT